MPEASEKMSADSLKRIMAEEDFSNIVYKDSRGNETIGYGTTVKSILDALKPGNRLREKVVSIVGDTDESKLRAIGISEEQAKELFNIFFDEAVKDAKSIVGEETFTKLSPARQQVLVDLCYNIGKGKAKEFKNMIKAIKDENYAEAAYELMNSLRATQVPLRTLRDAWLMYHGTF